jgi:hypothetical protein
MLWERLMPAFSQCPGSPAKSDVDPIRHRFIHSSYPFAPSSGTGVAAAASSSAPAAPFAPSPPGREFSRSSINNSPFKPYGSLEVHSEFGAVRLAALHHVLCACRRFNTSRRRLGRKDSAANPHIYVTRHFVHRRVAENHQDVCNCIGRTTNIPPPDRRISKICPCVAPKHFWHKLAAPFHF